MQSTTVVHERRWLWLALLAVFALHNAEEWRGWAHQPVQALPIQLPASLYAPQPLLAAMLVLTLVAAVLCVIMWLRPRPWAWQLSMVLCSALAGNALVHIVRSLLSWNDHPGLYTALPMLLIAGMAIFHYWNFFAASVRMRVGLILLGWILMFPTIALALLAGNALVVMLNFSVHMIGQ